MFKTKKIKKYLQGKNLLFVNANDDGLVFCFEITSDGIFLSELFRKSLNLLQKKVIIKTGLIQSRPNFYSKLIFIILIYIQFAIE